MGTSTRNESIDWGSGSPPVGVSVKSAAGAVLLSRVTTGIAALGNGQYGIQVPNWDDSWGAALVLDDGTNTVAGTTSTWLDPLVSAGAAPSGYVGINQDTGGPGSLRVISNGQPVLGAVILVFLASSYSSNPTTAPQLGWTTTDVNGNWVRPIYVQTGNTYCVLASAVGDQPQLLSVTV